MKKPPTATAWKPGQSGNPAGRQSGTVNAATRLRKLIDVEGVVNKLQELALAGDVHAARTLLERALPVYRASAEPLDVPALNDAVELTDKAHAVLAAVADGRIPPDLGAQLVAAIGTVARVVEVDELARRVAALEGRDDKSA
ncbi:DUF5681 domain-containing protein [Rhodanobacter sp. L36]|uniref:DUF5681 domain-containing protein n=1 Tax=Rhodanobacter sp. L36 TaxID=1747221 RepID=UPI0020B164CE|nr:DUF5681 domain-containing protein [Rhodanobacter sp. L36]